MHSCIYVCNFAGTGLLRVDRHNAWATKSVSLFACLDLKKINLILAIAYKISSDLATVSWRVNESVVSDISNGTHVSRIRAGDKTGPQLISGSGAPHGGAPCCCGYSMPGLWNFEVSNSEPVPWQTAQASWPFGTPLPLEPSTAPHPAPTIVHFRSSTWPACDSK